MAEETQPQITPEIVKQRAAVAGLSIDGDRLEAIATLMENALAPLRAIDPRANQLVEPAFSFDPSAPSVPQES